MKRTLLALFGVLVLSLAGSMIVAQTDYGNTNDPPAADQPTGSSSSDVTGSQSGTNPTSPTDPATADPNDPNRDPSMDQYQQGQNPDNDPNRTLPATASYDPLVLALGLSALGGLVMLRIVRPRRVR